MQFGFIHNGQLGVGYLLGHFKLPAAVVITEVAVNMHGSRGAPTQFQLEVAGVAAGPVLTVPANDGEMAVNRFPLQLAVGANQRVRCQCLSAPAAPENRGHHVSVRVTWGVAI